MNQYIEQLKKVWSDFTLTQKLSIGAAIAVVVIGLGSMAIWSSKPEMQLLYGKMDNSDLADAISLIESNNIKYKIGAGGNSLYVPADDVYKLRIELASNGIPSGGTVGYEIFDRPNFGISDFVQRTNYIRAVQGELSRTVAQVRGVKSARVMITIPENKLLAEQTNTKATASVFVDTGGLVLAEDAINSIRFLVANSVEALDVNNVAVVDKNGNVLSEQLKSDGTLTAASGQLRYRKSLEDYFSKKIETMLSRVIGNGSVVARVSVDLNPDATTIVEEKFDPDGQVVRSQTVTEDTTTSSETRAKEISAVASKTPGADSNGGTEPASSSQGVRKNKTIAYEINRTKLETVKAPGTIRDISASVFISMQQEINGKSGGFNPKPRTKDEIESIKQMVINALGITKDKAGSVSIQEMPFVKEERVVMPNEFGVPEPLLKWAEFLKGYGSIGIALLMFVVFLKMLKKHKPQMTSLEIVDDKIQTDNSILRQRESSAKPTADLINELIQEKPENVSAALQNWITSTQTK